MINAVRAIPLTILLTLGSVNSAFATHDQGQGKSQDHDELGSLSTAPEPSTIWLFLTGTLGLVAHGRRKLKKK